MSDNRNVVYKDGSTWVYRASGVGSHPHVLSAARLGYEPLPASDKLQQIFNEGNLHEQPVIDYLINEKGWEIRNQQYEVEIEVAPNVVIRGHIDGERTDQAKVFDVKTMSQDSYKKWIASRWDGGDLYKKYAKTIGIYARGLSLDKGAIVAKNRNNGDIDIFEFDIAELPTTADDTIATVLEVETMAQKNELVDSEGCTTYPCSYLYLHTSGEGVTIEDDEVLDTIATNYAKGRELEQQGKLLKEEARDKLMEVIGSGEKKATNHFTISRTKSVRKYVDAKALENEYPDVYEKFAAEKVTETVRVTERKS